MKGVILAYVDSKISAHASDVSCLYMSLKYLQVMLEHQMPWIISLKVLPSLQSSVASVA